MRSRLAVVALACLLGLMGVLAGPARAADAPTLALAPDHGPCGVAVMVRGVGFPAGLALVLQQGGDNGAILDRVTAGEDGAFTTSVTIRCGPDTHAGATVIVASPDKAVGQPIPGDVRATASFMIESGIGDPAAWAAERARVPTDLPVYRPTWLPARFNQPPIAVANGLEYGVVYTSDEGDRLLFGLTGNTCGLPAGDTSQTIEPYAVHGINGMLVINTRPDCPPRIGVFWQEAGGRYAIQANATTRADALSRDELRLIVDGLAPVGLDGEVAPQCFPETGQCVTGRFLAYWLAHGGLAVNGYPISGEFNQQLADGPTYRVQYFERVRMEDHPENQAPYDVLLGQFGRQFHPADPSVSPIAGQTYFQETGHNVAPDFFQYWQANGGLAQFGYPISEELQEQLEDGQTYTVQYFERARFERHPDNQPPWNIELGQFGRRALAGAGH